MLSPRKADNATLAGMAAMLLILLAANRAVARYYGTFNRTLLAIYAGAIILLSVTL